MDQTPMSELAIFSVIVDVDRLKHMDHVTSRRPKGVGPTSSGVEAQSVLLSPMRTGLEIIVYSEEQIVKVEGFAVWKLHEKKVIDPTGGDGTLGKRRAHFSLNRDVYIQEGKFINMSEV